MHADTSHIKACRAAFDDHYAACPHCDNDTGYLCEQGQVLWDEITAAITASRDVEQITVGGIQDV